MLVDDGSRQNYLCVRGVDGWSDSAREIEYQNRVNALAKGFERSKMCVSLFSKIRDLRLEKIKSNHKPPSP